MSKDHERARGSEDLARGSTKNVAATEHSRLLRTALGALGSLTVLVVGLLWLGLDAREGLAAAAGAAEWKAVRPW